MPRYLFLHKKTSKTVDYTSRKYLHKKLLRLRFSPTILYLKVRQDVLSRSIDFNDARVDVLLYTSNQFERLRMLESFLGVREMRFWGGRESHFCAQVLFGTIVCPISRKSFHISGKANRHKLQRLDWTNIVYDKTTNIMKISYS